MRKINFKRVACLDWYECKLPSLEFTLYLTDDDEFYLDHVKLPLINAGDEVGVIVDKDEILWYPTLYKACSLEYLYSGDYITEAQETAMTIIANHISVGYGEDLEEWWANG